MQAQNYQNHRKLDPKYHFVLAPLMLLILAGTVILFISSLRSGEMIWFSSVQLLTGIALFLAVFLIRTYPLRMQDRVIRAEQQLRHYILTGQMLDPRLSLKQIAGLRFAGDKEFPELCRRAANERLSGEQIKQLIQEWTADHDRI